MNIQELATAKQLGINPKIIILNNTHLEWFVKVAVNSSIPGAILTSHDTDSDFKVLAEAYGHVGIVKLNIQVNSKGVERCFRKIQG